MDVLSHSSRVHTCWHLLRHLPAAQAFLFYKAMCTHDRAHLYLCSTDPLVPLGPLLWIPDLSFLQASSSHAGDPTPLLPLSSPRASRDSSPFFLWLHPSHTPGLSCSVHLSSVHHAALTDILTFKLTLVAVFSIAPFLLMLAFLLLSPQISGNRGRGIPEATGPHTPHLVFCPSNS